MFGEFLNHEEIGRVYEDGLREVVEQGGSRLVIDLGHLRRVSPVLFVDLVQRPADVISAMQRRVQENVALLDPSFQHEVFLGFSGAMGRNHVSPRNLSASMIGNLVKVDGIVTKCGSVRPKVTRSVHYSEPSKSFYEQLYRDSTSLKGLPTSTVYPTKTEEGHALVTEYGLSEYKDYQLVTVQEMPENAPPGQLPRSVEVILENDLVDKMKPGDRVRLCGVYRAVSGARAQGHLSGLFRTVLLANHVDFLSQHASQPRIRESTLSKIRTFAARMSERRVGAVVDALAKSVAPSIYGHEVIKKAILLLLVGGQEKNLENGTHLRGDINMLMMGDPSTAKSQLLRFAMKVAPLAISTTGRGSSGVGLTAAVTVDSDTGDRQLQAGAMVLADRGVVCIDEFDKMNDMDRVAMHEVMEQQTVTIAKAGIHTSLNARCAVLAAANPVYGNYDASRRPMDNIGLPDSLLSRFDLLFIILDSLSADQDRKVAEHVLKLHRFRSAEESAVVVENVAMDVPSGNGDPQALERDEPEDLSANLLIGHGSGGSGGDTLGGELGDGAENDGDDEEDEDDGGLDPTGSSLDFSLKGIYQRYNPLLHRERNVLKLSFLKQYISFAKRMRPDLTEEACETIAVAYSELRHEAHSEKNSLPVTPRLLETLIRLATAHAKARLATAVSVDDTQEAIRLVKYALYQENLAEEAAPRNAPPPPASSASANTPGGQNGSANAGRESEQKKRGREPDAASAERRSKRATVVRTEDDEDHNGDDADIGDPFGFGEGDDENGDDSDAGAGALQPSSARSSRRAPSRGEDPGVVDSAAYNDFLRELNALMRSTSGDITVDRICAQTRLARDVVVSFLRQMDKDNLVFFDSATGHVVRL